MRLDGRGEPREGSHRTPAPVDVTGRPGYGHAAGVSVEVGGQTLDAVRFGKVVCIELGDVSGGRGRESGIAGSDDTLVLLPQHYNAAILARNLVQHGGGAVARAVVDDHDAKVGVGLPLQ